MNIMVEHKAGFVSYALMKEYEEEGVLKRYDITSRSREEHDKEARLYREEMMRKNRLEVEASNRT